MAREINRGETQGRQLAASTIMGLKDKAQAEGDGVMRLVRWLDQPAAAFTRASDG